jgi:hypothetical protein
MQVTGSLYRPINVQRSSKTRSKRARKPDGNSTKKKVAWPSHVVRRELPPPERDERKLGAEDGDRMGRCRGDGEFALDAIAEVVQC